MESDDIRKLKDLQTENQARKQIVADQALLIKASKKLLRKNGLRPPTEGRGPTSCCRTAYQNVRHVNPERLPGVALIYH